MCVPVCVRVYFTLSVSINYDLYSVITELLQTSARDVRASA